MRQLSRIAFSAFLLSSSVSTAQSPSGEGCADPGKLKGICDAVYKNFDPPKGTENRFDYLYEKQVHDAACVAASDSDELAARKIQAMWSKLEREHLTCDGPDFDVSRGSILKYAVAVRNWEFLVTAVEDWRVNLNKIDPSDDRTLLDYVQKEMERTKSDPDRLGQLRTLHRALKKLGARHRSELP